MARSCGSSEGPEWAIKAKKKKKNINKCKITINANNIASEFGEF